MGSKGGEHAIGARSPLLTPSPVEFSRLALSRRVEPPASLTEYSLAPAHSTLLSHTTPRLTFGSQRPVTVARRIKVKRQEREGVSLWKGLCAGLKVSPDAPGAVVCLARVSRSGDGQTAQARTFWSERSLTLPVNLIHRRPRWFVPLGGFVGQVQSSRSSGDA